MLAGTTEARRLAEELAGWDDVEVVVSLAGATSAPAALPCDVRTGGFGGVDGLSSYLRKTGVSVLVDATHPFATTMSAHAAAAAERCRIPRLRLVRPPWERTADDHWIEAADMDDAAAIVRRHPAERVLLTIGRLELAGFRDAGGSSVVVRTIEHVDAGLLPGAVVVQDRGPFTVDEEIDLLRRHRIDLVVTKNSGGADAKLVAARAGGIPVVMVARPEEPAGPSAPTVADALRWLRDQRGPGLRQER